MIEDPAEVARRLARQRVGEIEGLAAKDKQRALSHSDWYTRPRPRPKPRDGKEELPRERFFARVRAFELACPRCGWLWSARGHQEHGSVPKGRSLTGSAKKPRAWDPRTHCWTCRRCNLRLQLGLVAYVAPYDPARTYPPEDTVPTLAEGRALAAAGAPVPDAAPAPPLAARALELSTKTGEPLHVVLEKLEKAARGLAWRAWGATLRGELKRERLPKNSRINKLHGDEPK